MISGMVKRKQTVTSNEDILSPCLRQEYTLFSVPPQSTAEVFPKRNQRRRRLPSPSQSILLLGIVSLISKRYTVALPMRKVYIGELPRNMKLLRETSMLELRFLSGHSPARFQDI